jgi:dipeptidyl aminopeptidase/acylaminoacyl peptidase
MKKQIPLTVLFIIVHLFVNSQEIEHRFETVVYKKTDTVSLIMKVIYPPDIKKTKKYPGMVFFSGKWGHLKQFEPHAEYFSSKGIVCFLVQHFDKIDQQDFAVWSRTANAKSSIRYIRLNANDFHVNESKIIAAGGSSGGHLAAATALINCCDDPNDNLSISPKPNALVLFNPVLDLGPIDPEIFEMLGERYIEISPLQNIRKGAPPSIILHGTADQFIPVSEVEYYRDIMQAIGSRCELVLYDNQNHGFFDYQRSKENYLKTILEVEKFLISLGYLNCKPTIFNNE